MVQAISSMVDIRTSCYAARLAAFSCPQKHWKVLIFRGALLHGSGLPCEIPSDIEVYLMLGAILGLYQSFDKIYF
jgi:hypothetical protein